jgi:hypothetical protein
MGRQPAYLSGLAAQESVRAQHAVVWIAGAADREDASCVQLWGHGDGHAHDAVRIARAIAMIALHDRAIVVGTDRQARARITDAPSSPAGMCRSRP